MGFNGKDSGLSVIYFNFDTDPSKSLTLPVYDCNHAVSDDNVLDLFNDVTTCQCTYCDLACPIPDVNGNVLFFDGCDWELVGIIYAAFIVVAAGIEVFRHCYKKKQDIIELQNDKNDGTEQPYSSKVKEADY